MLLLKEPEKFRAFWQEKCTALEESIMTFGRTLQELTGLCGVKRCNLAAALGYDPSYISRWINGIKLPALRNNDTLFDQLAVYLTENASDEVRERIAAQFALACKDVTDSEAFAAALSALLAKVHASDRERETSRPAMRGYENAVIGPVKEIALFPESIFQVLRQISAPERLEMICTMPIHAQFKNNEFFFRRVLDSLPANAELRVMQFVDMDDISSKTDISCRSFCYLMGLGKKIRYSFYDFHASKTGYIYLIRDGLLLQYIQEPFSRELHLLETGDKELIGRYCASADAYVRERVPIAQVPDMQHLLQKQYFLDYFMQPRCRCLLRHMQPFFFPEELQAKLFSDRPDMLREMRLFLDGSEFFESILLYQLALVDYIYTGRLMILDSVIEVSPEDRLIHLRHMVAQLKKAPKRLCILSTQNRICSYDDISVSVFTNQHTAFVLNSGEGQNNAAYTVNSGAMVKQLNIWFNHLLKLPAEQCLTGQAAIDYILRCIRLL